MAVLHACSDYSGCETKNRKNARHKIARCRRNLLRLNLYVN